MSTIFSTPEQAEAAFYDAIESADMAALDAVWSRDENIVCVHPGASRIEGRSAVMQSFEHMFSEAPVLEFTIIDTLYTGNEALAIHLVREEIALDGEVVSIMVSTNIFQMEDGGWRMLLHHASPEPDTAFGDDMDDLHGFDDIGFDDLDDDWEEPEKPPVLH